MIDEVRTNTVDTNIADDSQLPSNMSERAHQMNLLLEARFAPQ